MQPCTYITNLNFTATPVKTGSTRPNTPTSKATVNGQRTSLVPAAAHKQLFGMNN